MRTATRKQFKVKNSLPERTVLIISPLYIAGMPSTNAQKFWHDEDWVLPIRDKGELENTER